MQILLPNTAPDMTICKKFQYCRRVKKRSVLPKKTNDKRCTQCKYEEFRSGRNCASG